MVGAKRGESASGVSVVKAFVQPATCEFQLSVNRGLGKIQQFCSFIGRESEKKAELQHAAFAWVQLVQFIQYPIQIHHLDRLGDNPRQLFIHWNRDSAVALLSALLPGVIQEYPPHEARRQAVEMFAIFKAQAALPDQLEKQLIDDAGGLQDVFRPLSTEKRRRDLSQLGIDQVKKAVNGIGSSLAPLSQEFCHFTSVAQAGESLPRVFSNLDSSAKDGTRHADF